MTELLCTIPIVAFYVVFVHALLRSLQDEKVRRY